MSLLPRTFLFLPGIGPVRELALWRRGIDSWGAYRRVARIPGIRPHIKTRHDALLEMAEAAYPRDPSFFARTLPTNEHWRAFSPFGEGAAYVDIETTGDRQNDVTVVGVRLRGESRAFVRVGGGAVRRPPQDDARWHDYTTEAVSSFLADATCLVTFNGATFDLPVLANDGVKIPGVPHVDLRPVLARVGYTGGLKKIEETLGFARHDGVKGLSGWDAVKLWRKWESRGDEDALRTLVEYNVADFENLEPLARLACDKLRIQTLAEVTAQSRLDEAPEATLPAGP